MSHQAKVTLPIDRLAELWPDKYRGLSVGALLHSASVGSDLKPTLSTLEELQSAGLIQLAALFGPQHGFDSVTQDNMVEWQSGTHPRLDIPLYSLYGEHRQPTDKMLSGIDLLFVDLVDIGSRYYTFIWTLFLAIQACEKAGIPIVVADRPNPLNGVTVEGLLQSSDYLSFVGLYPLPNRHAQTIGELAQLFKDEHAPGCEVTVLPMSGWQREMYYDETHLPWVMPSPNMPTLDTALVYPGMCLFEGTNVSEGRGTTRPFELFGAPWIDSRQLSIEFEKLELPGVHLRETAFQPGFQKFSGEICCGGQLHITDRDSFLPWRTGVELIQLIKNLYPNDFEWKSPPYEYEYDKLPIEILCGCPVDKVFN